MFVTRFAPSPTGYLHLGHAYAALYAFEAGERFVLRIEDIDPDRCRPEFEAAICDDLRWLGLQWDEPVLRQSRRAFAYREALQRLQERMLVYPCFCTRKEIAAEIARAAGAPHGAEGPTYPGLCRHLPDDERRRRIQSGAPFALRLDAAKSAAIAGPLRFEERGSGPNGESGSIEVEPLLLGDVVLARKELPAAYHLAVVVDDAYQGITLVTRGHDLFAAAHIQRLLQSILDLPALAYAHHRLILDANGKKFSKRDSSVTLRALRDAGVTPERIRAQLGF
jgi:glutamyl-Q tRNA(Asp) synthetase